MSINIALTEDQRSLLQASLEIARERFKEDAKISLLKWANTMNFSRHRAASATMPATQMVLQPDNDLTSR
jgi:hypothetical protein